MSRLTTVTSAGEADRRLVPSQRSVAIGAVVGLAVVAWGLLLAAELTGVEGLVDHDVAVDAGLPGAPLFITGWVIMIAAMMLPSVHPLLAVFERTVADRDGRVGLMVRLVGGYLLIWTAAGVAAYMGDLGVHALEDRTALLAGREWMLTAGMLAIAGGFQFTPLKDRCLTACRTPAAFVERHWEATASPRDALRLGVAHGRFCLGCCWALMLVMFALSTASLVWMLVLGAVMTVEKTATWGRRLVPVAGTVALLGAAGLAVTNLV